MNPSARLSCISCIISMFMIVLPLYSAAVFLLLVMSKSNCCPVPSCAGRVVATPFPEADFTFLMSLHLFPHANSRSCPLTSCQSRHSLSLNKQRLRCCTSSASCAKTPHRWKRISHSLCRVHYSQTATPNPHRLDKESDTLRLLASLKHSDYFLPWLQYNVKAETNVFSATEWKKKCMKVAEAEVS